ncbi:MAG: UDP-N-acetylmuramoyl-tripeptide--D-alanyl-D-alanine ligase [Ruminiclostridium sp.]|nr:UDP-N-acetylmuramoyl-tripeptide--D-alanyl-D-alanine ligase [Ruminiclostridium sp.]
MLAKFTIDYVHFMHMFQLNSYSAREHFEWHRKNGGDFIKRAAMPAVYWCVSLIIGCGAYYGGGYIMYVLSDMLPFIGTVLMAVGVIISALEWKKPVKKKLVFTPRVIRMCVTTAVIYGAVCALSFIFLRDSKLYFTAAALLPVFCVFMPPLANLINKPIERSVNNYYIKDAKRIISELPNTTVIGITGSYGKTSTKFYLEKLLSVRYNVLMTPGSFNTTMGVVKVVRGSLNATHEIFLCEMGAKKVGEIKEICDIVHPKHSVITSIGEQHLETFGSVENIIRTKFEIADCITDGKVFLNYDNEHIRNRETDKDKVTYGISGGDFDYTADNISVTAKGTDFTVHHGGESAEFHTKLLGEHNVQNILGAIAVSHELGIPLAELALPVKRLQAVPHRMEILDKGSGVTIIDDAFNSNPAGARAALKTLSMFDALRIVATPGMIELGEREYQLNKELGMDAAGCCDIAILVGERQAPPIKEGLLAKGFPENHIIVAKDLKEAMNAAYSIQPGRERVILLENDLPDNF